MPDLPQMDLLSQVQQYISKIDSGKEPDFEAYEMTQQKLKNQMKDLTKMIKDVQKGKLDKFPIHKESKP